MNVLGHVLRSGQDESISVSGLRVVEFYCSPHAWIRSPVSHLVDLVMGAAVPFGYKYDSVVLLGFPSFPFASSAVLPSFFERHIPQHPSVTDPLVPSALYHLLVYSINVSLQFERIRGKYPLLGRD